MFKSVLEQPIIHMPVSRLFQGQGVSQGGPGGSRGPRGDQTVPRPHKTIGKPMKTFQRPSPKPLWPGNCPDGPLCAIQEFNKSETAIENGFAVFILISPQLFFQGSCYAQFYILSLGSHEYISFSVGCCVVLR